MENIDLAKWMPLISAVIAGLVAGLIAMINNYSSRSKSLNEWRREKALELIWEFKKYEGDLDRKLFEISDGFYTSKQDDAHNIKMELGKIFLKGSI